jgi:hypothetical protein
MQCKRLLTIGLDWQRSYSIVLNAHVIVDLTTQFLIAGLATWIASSLEYIKINNGCCSTGEP